MLLHDYLRETAARYDDELSLIFAKKVYSFREIDEASDRLAWGLQRLGVRRGDPVAAILDNSIELVVSFWATLKAAAVFVPASPKIKADKLAFLLGGAAVALGCLNELELPAEKFVEDPFAPQTGAIAIALYHGRAVASGPEKPVPRPAEVATPPTARSRPLMPGPGLQFVAAEVRPCR